MWLKYWKLLFNNSAKGNSKRIRPHNRPYEHANWLGSVELCKMIRLRLKKIPEFMCHKIQPSSSDCVTIAFVNVSCSIGSVNLSSADALSLYLCDRH